MTSFSKKKDMPQMKAASIQARISPVNTHLVGIQKYQRGIQHKPGENKAKIASKAPLNKLILSSNTACSIPSRTNPKCTQLKSAGNSDKKSPSNYSSNPTPLQQLSNNMRNQMRLHNKNSTSLHITSNPPLSNQSKYSSVTAKPQGKVTYSYCNTISSTNNTDNNNNMNNAQVESRLLAIIDQMKADENVQVEFLSSNIFLNKLISYFSGLLSSDYQLKEILKNEELKGQFHKLEHKLSYYALYNNYSNANVLNADMLSSDYPSEANPSAVESNNRKDVYRTFFDFFDDISKKIKDIVTQLPNPQPVELKKIEEVNSKISSLHSRITLTNKGFDCNCNDSSFHTNAFLHWNENSNLNITKENMTNMFLKGTTHEQFPSLLISSINSEFYQQLINESNDLSMLVQGQLLNERKGKMQLAYQPCDYLESPLTKFGVISPINGKAPLMKDESRISDKTIQNEESCYDQTVLDEMKASTLNINPNDYCHTKEEYEQKPANQPNGQQKLPQQLSKPKPIPQIKKKEDDKCTIF